MWGCIGLRDTHYYLGIKSGIVIIKKGSIYCLHKITCLVINTPASRWEIFTIQPENLNEPSTLFTQSYTNPGTRKHDMQFRCLGCGIHHQTYQEMGTSISYNTPLSNPSLPQRLRDVHSTTLWKSAYLLEYIHTSKTLFHMGSDGI